MAKKKATPHNKGKVCVLTVTTQPGLSNILIEDIIRKVSACNGVVTVSVAFKRQTKVAPVGVVEVLWPERREEGPNLLDFMEEKIDNTTCNHRYFTRKGGANDE